MGQILTALGPHASEPPGNPGDRIVTQRRGQRKYRLVVTGRPHRLGQQNKRPPVVRWANGKLEQIGDRSSRTEPIAVEPVNIRSEAFPLLLPHRYTATLLMSYLDPEIAARTEEQIRTILGRKGFRWELELISDRPPMKERKASARLAKALAKVAEQWEIPLAKESSLWPSVGGLVPGSAAVLCGMGPVAQDLYTPNESIQRIGLLQRTLLLTQ